MFVEGCTLLGSCGVTWIKPPDQGRDGHSACCGERNCIWPNNFWTDTITHHCGYHSSSGKWEGLVVTKGTK